MANIVYFARETLRGFYQAKLMTFISIITISVTLFFLGCIVILFLNIQDWFKDAAKQSGFVLYLDEQASLDTTAAASIAASIDSLPEVDSVTVITKQQALDRFTKLYGSEMLDAVEDNPLPASIELALNQTLVSDQTIEAFKRKIKDFGGVESIHYSQEWISIIRHFKKIFLVAISLIIPVLLIALHFMITNTIKLTIYARKDLITNMRYVGATDLFIQIPFLFEGILQGGIGSLIAVGVLAVVKLLFSQFSFSWGGWYIPSLLVLFGVLFGFVGSKSAVRRFLV